MKAHSPNPHYKPALAVWFDYYKLRTGQNYVMDAKSGNHLKQLLKKVETKLTERGMAITEANVCNSLSGFLHSIRTQWVLDNLDLAIVNSKFNVEYSKAFKSNPFNVASRIDDLVDLRANLKRAEGQN